MGNPKCFLLYPFMGNNTSNTSRITGPGHFDLSFMEVWVLWQSKTPSRGCDRQGTANKWERPRCLICNCHDLRELQLGSSSTKRKNRGCSTPTAGEFIGLETLSASRKCCLGAQWGGAIPSMAERTVAGFLSLLAFCIGRHFGYGNWACSPGKTNSPRQNAWLTQDFRRWTRMEPSSTTVSSGISDTSPWKRNTSNDPTAQGDKPMLLVLWKYFRNDKENLVKEKTNLFIALFSRQI